MVLLFRERNILQLHWHHLSSCKYEEDEGLMNVWRGYHLLYPDGVAGALRLSLERVTNFGTSTG